MNGHTFSINGSHTCWSDDGHLLECLRFEASEEGCFASSCFACEEYAAIGMLHIFVCQFVCVHN